MSKELKNLETVTKATSVSKQEEYEARRLAKRKKVRGLFKFYEIPGGRLQFNFKKYKGDPIELCDYADGEVYEIPLGVAEHLNATGWYPEYGYAAGSNAFDMGLAQVKRKVRRYGFSSLEFVDESSLDLSRMPAPR